MSVRQLRLWIDDPALGCGQHILLAYNEGRAWLHCLHVPTLANLKIELSEVARQERTGLAQEIPITRGVIGRIIEKRKAWNAYGFRYSSVAVEACLAALREGKGA